MDFLDHPRDPAYLVLGTVVLVGLLVIVVACWRDVLRSARELLSLFRFLRRPQIRLWHVGLGTVVGSVTFKIVSSWEWTATTAPSNILGVVLILLALSLLTCLLWSCCSNILERRHKLRDDARVELPSEDSTDKPTEPPSLKIRFPETSRQTTAFKR